MPSEEQTPVQGEPQGSQAPHQAPHDGAREVWTAALSWTRDMVLSVVLAVLAILFVYQPVKVEGTSMMPAIQDQERIFINKFLYRFGMGEITRGDTVVFWYPGDPSKSFIKRVIGGPGDRVEVKEGTVLLNGKKLDEPYVPGYYRDQVSMEPVTVPADEYFVLGDHRSSSSDSRSWGPVHKRHIYGKAVFVYWPLDKLGLIH
jgi:signal peptidase I